MRGGVYAMCNAMTIIYSEPDTTDIPSPKP